MRLFFYVREFLVMEYMRKEAVPYLNDYEQLVTGLGYQLVELQVIHKKTSILIKAVIYSKNGIGVDDCSKVHRLLLSRAEVLLNSQDIEMEVSSPGLNRVIKNAYEFHAFIEENIKVLEGSDWIEGTLVAATAEQISIETPNGQKNILHKDIKKAKLNKS